MADKIYATTNILHGNGEGKKDYLKYSVGDVVDPKKFTTEQFQDLILAGAVSKVNPLATADAVVTMDDAADDAADDEAPATTNTKKPA